MSSTLLKVFELLDCDSEYVELLMEQIIKTKSNCSELLTRLRKASCEKTGDRFFGEQLYKDLIKEFTEL